MSYARLRLKKRKKVADEVNWTTIIKEQVDTWEEEEEGCFIISVTFDDAVIINGKEEEMVNVVKVYKDGKINWLESNAKDSEIIQSEVRNVLDKIKSPYSL